MTLSAKHGRHETATTTIYQPLETKDCTVRALWDMVLSRSGFFKTSACFDAKAKLAC